jgi:hypothetical protein
MKEGLFSTGPSHLVKSAHEETVDNQPGSSQLDVQGNCKVRERESREDRYLKMWVVEN